MGRRKKRYSKEFKLKILKELEESKQSISNICEKHGVSRSTVYSWKNRYSKKGKEGLANPFRGSGKLKEYLERFEDIF